MPSNVRLEYRPALSRKELVAPLDGHKAASYAAEFDLSQRVLGKEMAFYLVLDSRCRVVQSGERT